MHVRLRRRSRTRRPGPRPGERGGAGRAQAGFDDDRVMLQGFYWESYRHGHPGFPRSAATLVRDRPGQADAIREGRFDLIWLPPPSSRRGRNSAPATSRSEYFRLANSYGTFEEHRAMLEELLRNGIEPVADIVVNHRDGSTGWADFHNPDWGPWAICATDEAFHDPESRHRGHARRTSAGADEGAPAEYTRHGGTTHAVRSFRDIAHTNRRVRRDIVRYLLAAPVGRLPRLALRHGARVPRALDRPVQPADAPHVLRRRIRLGRAQRAARLDLEHRDRPRRPGDDHLRTASSVFDFTTAVHARETARAATTLSTATATASGWSATPRTGCPGRTGR